MSKEVYGYITLSSINTVLHTFCVILLLKTYKLASHTVQHLLLLNLSMAELVRNALSLVRNVLVLFGMVFQKKYHIAIIIKKTLEYFNFAVPITTHTIFLIAITLLTSDRLAATVLNIKYKVVCTTRRAKIICFSSWFFSVIVLVPVLTGMMSVTAAEEMDSNSVKRKILIYTFLVMHVFYLVFAIISYAIMFTTFVRSRSQSISSSSGDTATQRSFLYWFTHSKFYVSLILITSFLIFSVFPIIYLVCARAYSWNLDVANYILMKTYLSDTVDAFVYFFLYVPVRRLLFQRMQSMRVTIKSYFCCQNEPVAVIGEQSTPRS